MIINNDEDKEMIDETEKWLLDPRTTQADIERIANSEE